MGRKVVADHPHTRRSSGMARLRLRNMPAVARPLAVIQGRTHVHSSAEHKHFMWDTLG